MEDIKKITKRQLIDLLPCFFLEEVEIIKIEPVHSDECFSFWVKIKYTGSKYLVVLDENGACTYFEGERIGCIRNALEYFRKLDKWGYIDFAQKDSEV